MTTRINDLGQPIGWAVPDWTPCERPSRIAMEGRTVRLEPLDPAKHGDDLWAAFSSDTAGKMWTYLPVGPYGDRGAFDTALAANAKSEDPLFHAVIDLATGKAVGFCTYLRIDPTNGVIEVGFITFSPLMQRTTGSTEAMYLMMARVFDELGYRRYEWKCDNLNAPSRAAAARLGFTYEGLFRQAVMYKGRNRDTAWFSILDSEWPAIKAAFQSWLDSANFDGDGRQKRALAALIAERRG
ncbi:MAG: GNAT family protein [Thalassobaculaceae bacterium]|nr:GNAT family protein [Thalassobaculaceae bacterium]